MSRPVLTAELRQDLKKNVKALRKKGYVPGVVYGNKIDNKNIMVKRNEVERILNQCEIGSSLELKINGKETMIIIKDIQRHVTKGDVIHLDFQELTKGEKIRVRLPIHVINKNLVESSTSVVQDQLKELEIQTIPQFLPDAINVDATLFKDVDVIKVKDLDIYNNENIEILSDPEQIVALLATVSMSEAAATEEEEEGSTLTDLY